MEFFGKTHLTEVISPTVLEISIQSASIWDTLYNVETEKLGLNLPP